MRSIVHLALAATVVSISACASVPMAPESFNAYAKSVSLPPPDRAHIYVYRNESFGGAVKMDLRLDGQPAGTTVANTFALLPVRPGPHTLVSDAENTSELRFSVLGGQVVFVWQEAKFGVLYARNQLQFVDPAQGVAGVRECNLIAFPPPPLPSLPPPPVQAPPALPPETGANPAAVSGPGPSS
jgi:hypothetical protein